MVKLASFSIVILASVLSFCSAAVDLYIDGSKKRIRVYDNSGGSCTYNYSTNWSTSEFYDGKVRCCDSGDSDFCWRIEGREGSVMLYYSSRFGPHK
ncbi:hypothetical protein BGZ88_006131, partial [Linnemannia elongata]